MRPRRAMRFPILAAMALAFALGETPAGADWAPGVPSHQNGDGPVHVSGRVVDSFGAGIGDAEIQIGPPNPASRTTSAADGRFSLDAAVPGLLVVSAPGHISTSVDWDHLTAIPAGTLQVVLQLAGSVSGEVLDSDGDPAVHAHVDLTVRPSEPLGAQSQTFIAQVLEDGSFEFGSLRPGMVEIRIVSRSGDERIDPPPFAIHEGERRDDLRLRLAPPLANPGNVIEGEVVDPEGQPVAAARVATVRDGLWDRIVTTDADGRFILPGLHPGRYALSARGPGTLNTIVRDVETGTRDLTIVVTPRGELIGTVVDDTTGEPLPAATVAGQQVASDGHFRIQLRSEGETVFVSAAGYTNVKLGPFSDVSGRTIDTGTVRLRDDGSSAAR